MLPADGCRISNCRWHISLVGLFSLQIQEKVTSARLVSERRVLTAASCLSRWPTHRKFVDIRSIIIPCTNLTQPHQVISLFWLGWAARPDIHWIVPIMAALPFGIGFLLIFMALINYVVDAYEVFAASAMGATSASRSMFGVVLPFAAKPMYDRLGVDWACTLLGILSALMCLIPFVFIKYGAKIRENSKFCQELKRKKADDEEKQRRRWERQRSRQALQDPEKAV